MATGKILIVEDEVIAVLTLSEILKRSGYNVCPPAFSGEEALERVAEEKPDLVLMDVSLQGKFDGIEIARQINEHYNLPIAFITGYTDEDLQQQAGLFKPVGIFIKPLNFQDLLQAIDRALAMEEKNRC